MELRHIALAAVTVMLIAACTKRDESLLAPAAQSAPEAAQAPVASASASLTASPATGEDKDRSWKGQVDEAKAVASAQGNAAQERADKAEAAAK